MAATDMNDAIYFKVLKGLVLIFTEFYIEVAGQSLKLIVNTIYHIILSTRTTTVHTAAHQA